MKKTIALLLALCLTLALASCGKNENGPAGGTGNETVLTDMIGRQVSVAPGTYKRVVCVGAGALRMFCYLCDPSLLCGVEDIDNLSLTERPAMFDRSPRPYVMAFGDSFRSLPSCGAGGPNAQSAEAEKILACAPDIVISEYGDEDKENALEKQIGVPVVTLRTGPEGVFGDLFKGSMRLLGTLFGAEDKAEALISFTENEIADIARRTADVPEEKRPFVYICGLGNWGTANHLTTAEDYAVFGAANIRNAVSGLGFKGVGEIEEEKFVSLGENTDIMIVDTAAVKNIIPLYAEDPSLFAPFKAWQNGETYLEMEYNAYYTNYEITLANAWFIAKTAYPDRFADVDMTEKLNAVTKAFLGKELAEEIFACPNSFGGYQKIGGDFFTF